MLASWMHKGSAMELPAGEKQEGDSAEALCGQNRASYHPPSPKRQRGGEVTRIPRVAAWRGSPNRA